MGALVLAARDALSVGDLKTMTKSNQGSVCCLLLLLCCSRSDRRFPECQTPPQAHTGTYLWDTRFCCPLPPGDPPATWHTACPLLWSTATRISIQPLKEKPHLSNPSSDPKKKQLISSSPTLYVSISTYFLTVSLTLVSWFEFLNVPGWFPKPEFLPWKPS